MTGPCNEMLGPVVLFPIETKNHAYYSLLGGCFQHRFFIERSISISV